MVQKRERKSRLLRTQLFFVCFIQKYVFFLLRCMAFIKIVGYVRCAVMLSRPFNCFSLLFFSTRSHHSAHRSVFAVLSMISWLKHWWKSLRYSGNFASSRKVYDGGRSRVTIVHSSLLCPQAIVYRISGGRSNNSSNGSHGKANGVLVHSYLGTKLRIIITCVHCAYYVLWLLSIVFL